MPSGSCCEKCQISLPGFKTEFTSVAFSSCFLQRFIINNGTAKKWKQNGRLCTASHNWQMSPSVAAGSGNHPKHLGLCACVNHPFGARTLKYFPRSHQSFNQSNISGLLSHDPKCSGTITLSATPLVAGPFSSPVDNPSVPCLIKLVPAIKKT
jgi:hypothetical protein